MVVAYIFAGIGIVSTIVSVVLSCFGDGTVEILSNLSTIISIVLGVVSIVYTFRSSKKTDDTLNEIKNQNKGFIEKITQELSDDNFDTQNLQNIREKIAKR